MTTRPPPPKLYKFCSFDIKALRLLSEAEAYYANPKDFNDPLDCDGTVRGDTDLASWEELCIGMLAAQRGVMEAMRAIQDLQHNSAEYGDYRTNHQSEKHYKYLLRSKIEYLIDAELGKRGVLCLAEDWNCPLMWSHYADRHRGLCIEYDTNINKCPDIKPVDYRDARGINISELIQWKLHNSSEAEKNVLETYFFAKSPSWSYEKEWRVICEKNGVKEAPFRISGVYFGLKCDSAVRTNIVMLFNEVSWTVELYDIALKDSRLDREPIDPGEVKACGGVREPASMGFEDLTRHENKDT
jgi:hypothetical protein